MNAALIFYFSCPICYTTYKSQEEAWECCHRKNTRRTAIVTKHYICGKCACLSPVTKKGWKKAEKCCRRGKAK